MYNVIDSLNGNVHSKGIKIGFRAWLDMGSEEWSNTSDEDKAAAYRAAKECGWTDQGLKSIILKEFGQRIDDFMARATIEFLQEISSAQA